MRHGTHPRANALPQGEGWRQSSPWRRASARGWVLRTLLLLPALLVACGQPDTDGVAEPFLVEGGKFLSGVLPGTPANDGGLPTTLYVTEVNAETTAVTVGEAGFNFSGLTTTDAYSVAVQLADAGTGYWVVPVQGPDPTQDGQLTWSFNADFAFTAPVGIQNLVFVAIGENGNAGEQQTLELCVLPDFPDNRNACTPTKKPPAAMVSLLWDSNADLDLVVRTPDGTLIDPKTPSDLDGGTETNPTALYIDRDSNANCVEDNIRREDAVWTDAPASGTYLIYVDEFKACGAPASSFQVLTYEMATHTGTKTTYSLDQTQSSGGVLLTSQANGDDDAPLYVTSISFP